MIGIPGEGRGTASFLETIDMPTRHRSNRFLISSLLAGTAASLMMAGCASSRRLDAPSAGPDADADVMRVLVWNVLHGSNDVTDGPEKALAVIRESNADVVLMQESYDIDGDRPLLGAWLAGQMGWNQWQGESPHLCVLTRFDIVDRFTHEPWHAVGATLVDDRSREFIAWSIWLDYRDYITRRLRDEPDMSDADLLESEFVRSSRLPQVERIIERLEGLGHLKASVPVMVGGDFNTPSHLDWTLDTTRVFKRRRDLDLPVSVAMAEAGFTDTFRTVHPNPVQRPGITWSPMFRTSGGKAQGFERIDRLYVHEPVGPDRGDPDEAADPGSHPPSWSLVPVGGVVYPLVWEDDATPVEDLVFPSDHGAVLIELVWRAGSPAG